MIYVFTATASNYLSKVKESFNSIKKYLPESPIYLTFADEIPDGSKASDFNADVIVKISDLGIPNWKSWIFGYSVIELCTAVKPFVLSYLLDKKDCEGVLFFDPDIVLFSRLDDLLAEFKQNSIILTPHQTKPEKTIDAIVDNEVCSLRHGIYNLGFIGVKNDEQGKSFAKWWSDRLYYFCRGELAQGFWMDQKWIDLVPAFFDQVKIVKNSRFNVAPWNITTRTLKGSLKNGFTVDDQPLGFYHFTGFDSGDHEIMANKYAGDNKALKSLIDWYKTTTKNNGEYHKIPWAYAKFDNGDPITPEHRFIYRTRKDLQEAFPDPFKVIKDDQCYFNWFQWRAPIEYPELVGAQKSNVTYISIPQSKKINWAKVRNYSKKSITNFHYGTELSRRAAIIVLQEGFKGLKRRLS